MRTVDRDRAAPWGSGQVVKQHKSQWVIYGMRDKLLAHEIAAADALVKLYAETLGLRSEMQQKTDGTRVSADGGMLRMVAAEARMRDVRTYALMEAGLRGVRCVDAVANCMSLAETARHCGIDGKSDHRGAQRLVIDTMRAVAKYFEPEAMLSLDTLTELSHANA